MPAPDNSLMKDVMTLVDNVVEQTDISATWTKSLPVFGFGDVEGQRLEDVEHLPQEFRFEAQDGHVSNPDNSDTQALIDRMIPIRRNKSFHIKSKITTKELRDPRLRRMAKDGFAQEIRNKIDVHCYQKAMVRAQMVQPIGGSEVTQADFSAAEVLMIDNGLGKDKKDAFISLPHYKKLADVLAVNQYHPGVPQTAYTRAQIPNMIAGFDEAVRADYRLTLKAATASGVTVTGNQKHEVKTKDINDNYIDNRQMNLVVSDNSDFQLGDKFTIDEVGRLNPEVREDTGDVMTFTVLDPNAGSNTITISPAIVVDGPYRNVTAQAADAAAITMLNTENVNPTIFYSDGAIQLIPGNLPVPEDAGGVEVVNAETEQGLPMRFTYWYNPDLETFFLKCVVFFDCEVWLPNKVGVLF